MIWAALKLVPGWVWVALAAAGLLTGSIVYVDHHGYVRGKAEIQGKWDVEHAEMLAAIEKEKARQAEVVTKTVIEYRDRVQVVKEKGDVIEKEVQVLVPVGSCDLPGGFRVLHDAAAGAIPVPDDPAGAAAAADAVEASAAAATIAENYTSCRADAERLRALQELLKGLK